MKRLYVRPAYRGGGLGRLLVERVIDEARDAGYERMRLDTPPTMGAALRLYRRLGFAEIPPYRPTRWRDAVFLELDLRRDLDPSMTAMTPESLAFLKSLLDTPGPSSFEAAPARVWRDEAEHVRRRGAGRRRRQLVRDAQSRRAARG